MRSLPEKQTIVIYILPDISRSNGYQTMKFGHIIETFFLKNHSQNVMDKIFPDSYLKNKIERISGSIA